MYLKSSHTAFKTVFDINLKPINFLDSYILLLMSISEN